MADFIIIVILFVAIGAAVAYIVKEKKRGAACIGCSCGGTCSKNKQSHSECSCQSKEHHTS